ncbi:MAG TPA: SRPBCC family protein [Polyangia bacterium]|nr:SRPBCC family protein [Polyangia bacterium]
METSPDRIVKQILLRAPRDRVWRAISDAREFGSWFGVELDGPFVAGAPLAGRMVPTTVDPEVARMQEPFRGARFELVVDRVEPPRLFSFRWHPFAVEPDFDYGQEPMTLVTFELAEAPGGTELTLTESGFDRLPPGRRRPAFSANDEGWAKQMSLVEKYLAHAT